DAVSLARFQPQAAAALAGPDPGHAHRLPLARHGRLAAEEVHAREPRAARPPGVPLDHGTGRALTRLSAPRAGRSSSRAAPIRATDPPGARPRSRAGADW